MRVSRGQLAQQADRWPPLYASAGKAWGVADQEIAVGLPSSRTF